MNANPLDNLLPLQQIVVRNPWNNAVIGKIPVDSSRQLRQKLTRAWLFCPALTTESRHEILIRASATLRQQKTTVAGLISRESGLSFNDACHEIEGACTILIWAAHEALSYVEQHDFSQKKGRAVYSGPKPLSGVVAAITSFNSPLIKLVQSVAPAIATNKSILLRPSEKIPLSALALQQILRDAGMPAAMFLLANCSCTEFVDLVAADKRVNLVSFSGSISASQQIASRIPTGKLVIDVGGINTLMVCADADLKLSAALAARGAFMHSGQGLMTIKRILVDRLCYASFVSYLFIEAKRYYTGNPLNPDVRLGTVIDEINAAEIEQRINISIALGAVCVCGNQRQGASVSATVLTDVTPAMPVMAKEMSGPVVSVMAFHDVCDAIRLINSTPANFSVSVFTRIRPLITHLVNELRIPSLNFNRISSPEGVTLCSEMGDFSDPEYQKAIKNRCREYMRLNWLKSVENNG